MSKAVALCALLSELIAGQHLKSAQGIIVMRHMLYMVGGHRQAWLNFLFAHIHQIFLLGHQERRQCSWRGHAGSGKRGVVEEGDVLSTPVGLNITEHLSMCFSSFLFKRSF